MLQVSLDGILFFSAYCELMQLLDLVQPVMTLHLDFGYKLLIMISNFSGNKNKELKKMLQLFRMISCMATCCQEFSFLCWVLMQAYFPWQSEILLQFDLQPLANSIFIRWSGYPKM